jgi:glycerophosphoryl diester phosphodiesterase
MCSLTKRFVVACSIAYALAAAACDAKESPPFHIQAHRGAGNAMPENTLESFEWAWKHDVTPESDLRMTKDGTIVCFHDPNFKRVPVNVTDSRKNDSIEKLSLSDVQKFDVGSFRGSQFAGQHVPTLASVFAEMRGHPERLLYIDIKSIKLDKLAALVRKFKVERQIIFTSEKPQLIRDWKKRVPESMTLLWNRGSEEELAKKMDDLRKADFADITHLQIHVKVVDINSDEPFIPSSPFLQSLGKELKAHHIVFQVFPADCTDEKAYQRLMSLGVESFATDHPELTLHAMQTFRAEPRQ